MNRKLFVIVPATLLLLAVIALAHQSTATAQQAQQPAPGSPKTSGEPGNAPPLQNPSGPMAALGSGFTYQGRLTSSGSPANGSYDLQFTLYDASSAGNVASGPITVLSQTVSDGLFTVPLDFDQPLPADILKEFEGNEANKGSVNGF